MFTKILIANRGEIACRIVKTAQRMGIQTVAVFSDADAHALHVEMADEAIHIGPSAAVDSYLNADRIIDAAKAMGAEALHPGYGFLSENPEFAEAISEAGLTFIGPSASAIRAMGLKDAAKSLMIKAGVPVVPGYHGSEQEGNRLMAEAAAIGYPVLIKARAGGGGKGMRRVDEPQEFLQALEAAQREAQASFGDPACLIEKFIAQPRHIEIQIFGDRHGQVVHMFERDCSLQRRHQKVIEEAPAPNMPDAVRMAMGAAAVEAAKAIGYEGAGTVEFIADGTRGLEVNSFWFMEMNTRLQVEHPVSEAITGLDFVELQLRVAAGEPLPITQADLAIDGWSFEARLYAEDVESGFLPVTGPLDVLKFPETGVGKGIRIDSGVRQGDVISPWYDPMIAKIIVHGPTRAVARARLAAAIEACQCFGATTNLEFLRALIADPNVASGQFDTGLIEQNLAHLTVKSPPQLLHLGIAAASQVISNSCNGGYRHGGQHANDPWQQLKGWCHWGPSIWEPMLVSVKGAQTQDIAVKLIINSPTDFVVMQGTEALPFQCYPCHDNLDALKLDALKLDVRHNGRVVQADLVTFGQRFAIICDGQTHIFEWPDTLASAEEEAQHDDAVKAPMPGFVKVIHIEVGAQVTVGTPVLVLEAMKMEHSLKAPRDGRIAAIHVTTGDQVSEGTVLLDMEL